MTLVRAPVREARAEPLRAGLAGGARRVRAGVLAQPAVVLAAALMAAWLIAAPRPPDLAAQVYRARLGLVVWDGYWYAGHHMPGYSVLFPLLASVVGVRVVGALAVVVSAALFSRLVGSRAWLAACWFALAAACDVWLGRVTFALGVSFGVAAVLALSRRRPRLAGVLALLCALASPVAGLFLALVGVAWWVGWRSRAAVVLVVPALVAAGALALLFPEGGSEPFATSALLATLFAAGATLVLLPGEERALRAGAALYLVAVVLSAVLSTPMGENVQRLGVLLCGPVVAVAWWGAGRRRASRPVVGLLGVVAVGLLFWQLRGPVLETAKAYDASTRASYYAPLAGWLAGRGPARVEVPFTRSHWEAALLAPRVPLARGWERQLDGLYDGLFYRPGLSAEAYRAWLVRNAVAYVALPDAPLDNSSRREAALIRAPETFLRPVWRSAHWRVFAVVGAAPLVSGAGSLVVLGHSGFTVSARGAGALVVRVRYTRWFAVVRGAGCVARGPGGWAVVRARRAGTVVVRARLSVAAAFGAGCR
jgi:hypothetical protein